MLELFMQPEAWAIFATLFALEVVLGVDNVVFISVLCERLPLHQRKLARNLGIGLAVIARIALVFSISWIMQLTTTVFRRKPSVYRKRRDHDRGWCIPIGKKPERVVELVKSQ